MQQAELLPMTIPDVREIAATILENVQSPDITRDDLVRKLESHNFPRGDVLRTLKTVHPTVYLKKNPIIYKTDLLLSDLRGTLLKPRGRSAPAPGPDLDVNLDDDPEKDPTKTLSTRSSTSAEVREATIAIDATNDPSITKFFPTKSYRHLLKRMNPEFPLNVFVWGETGVGKSTAPLYIAKMQRRPAIRVNLSKFTDADDLFGGMRIEDGTTYFDEGPVLVAMRIGAVLVLDEIDSADPALLTDLHPLFEKRGYLIKKLKKMVYPAAGFCIIATANTKGRGDMTGKYIGTNAINRALLDRCATGIHYENPTSAELKKIIEVSLTNPDPKIVQTVCSWYDVIDKAFKQATIDEHISPRKILDIIEMMMADNVTDLSSAEASNVVAEATNLMDDHVSSALVQLWDATVSP